MAVTKHILKFSSIVNFFSGADEKRLIQRGENAVESKHIESFQFIGNLGLLKGRVHASMRDKIYNIEINIDQDGEIKTAVCDCPRGQFICHHMAAICIYGHHNISVTDVECQWAAKKSKQTDVKTIDDIYLRKSHRSTDRDLTEEEIEKFSTSLFKSGCTVGFTWLLRPEPTAAANLLPDIEDLLFSEKYFLAENKLEYFLKEVKVTEDIIKKVYTSTVEQAKSENWLMCRKNRLTASNFGSVLAAISRNRYPPSLFKRLAGFYNLEKVHSVQWGVNNEQEALKKFTYATDMEVVPTGLWLHPCGFLGASPDGLIGDNAILEIKCPYKYREKKLTLELKTDQSYVVHWNNDEIIINKKHDYYAQIQGNLFITNREICYLIIWTPNENIIVKILKDNDWAQNIPLLKKFYVEHYLPHILERAFME